MSNNGWIGVDLDGTLAEYHGWTSETHIGPPIPAMQERVKQWVAEGLHVKIFTARVAVMGNVQDRNIDVIIASIQAWTLKHIGVVLEVTNVKDYAMVELWDDRAVQVEPNTGRILGQSTRGL